ncbi:hypothetical protein [Emticicia sp. BO119]|uniref:hypothetical protein n=1 Tax=Emticicia sp. BO119 TaxID=2757768 RepID=UPI0015F1046B|nr:hypothetical protein [Emticicia sp. BO119]MBA4851650.1 hypothetical protein [Emticicia sp. BO119]
MTNQVNPLIVSLVAGKISKEEFLKEYFKHIPRSNEYVLALIQKGINNRNAIEIEEAMTLIFVGSFSIKYFLPKLCELLQLPWHYNHEDIARLLKEIADPTTVDCLYKASELAFEYLDYDDTYQFARKCIKALSAISDENAIEKLKLLSDSKITEIAEYAKKELRYKGLL